MKIISRKEAKAQGLARYFTGAHCGRGHLDERYVSSLECISCYQLRKQTPENKAKEKEYRDRNKKILAEKTRTWVKENKERKRIADAEYRRANSGKLAKSAKLWYEKNKGKYNVYNRNYRARVRDAEGSHSIADIRELNELQRGKCAHCGCAISKRGKRLFHVDHITPLSKGGRNDRTNLQLLCKKCNLSKHAKDPIVWAQENGKLL